MCEPRTYVKRPVPVQAMRYDGSKEGLLALMEWCPAARDGKGGRAIIETLEGNMIARPGDYVIRGVHSEFYPCKANIFAETYQDADDAASKVTVAKGDLDLLRERLQHLDDLLEREYVTRYDESYVAVRERIVAAAEKLADGASA